jgi:hypothetical protein
VPVQMKNGENVTDGWWTIDPYERQPPPPYARLGVLYYPLRPLPYARPGVL